MSVKPATKSNAYDAIRLVLEADIASYLARDRDAWERCWVKDSRFRSFMECGTMQIAKSYNEFRENVFDAMDAQPDPVDANIRIENLEIEQNDDLAWATYEEIVSGTSNPQVAPAHSHNFRLLEHDDGQWRILFHGCWAEPLRDSTKPVIEVDEDGQIEWLNAAAQAHLKSFCGLTISHGRLRASKPSWDTGLQAAICGAHKLTGFGQYNLAKNEGGGEVRFPVVLGEADDGGLLFCWVKVADGRVYILFGDLHDLSKQIEVAQAIYGLSSAQAEIIRKISSGQDLAEAANSLGITKNTARTHLRRAFEKAGVSSQMELLRLLISFHT